MSAAAMLFLVHIGCDSLVGRTNAPPPAPPAPMPEPVVQAHMADDLNTAQEAVDALIAGDKARAASALRALADHPMPEGMPVGTKPMVAGFQGAAKQGAAAASLAEQAQAVANMAATCGGCHAMVGAHLEWTVPAAPPSEPGVRAHMARHTWAVNRMWQGLVGPTESAWSQAAIALNDEPTAQPLLPKDQLLTDETAAAAKRLHTLGTTALEADELRARVDIFGAALTACATCHLELSVGPK
jgi:cytochrome c553